MSQMNNAPKIGFLHSR